MPCVYMHLFPSLCPDWIVLCVCSWLVHVWLFLSGITSGPPCPHVTRTNQTRSSDQLFSDDVQITVFHSSPSAVVDVLQQDNSRKGVFVLTDCYFPPPLQLSVNVPSTTDVGWKTRSHALHDSGSLATCYSLLSHASWAVKLIQQLRRWSTSDRLLISEHREGSRTGSVWNIGRSSSKG